jgi:hypothetical protein
MNTFQPICGPPAHVWRRRPAADVSSSVGPVAKPLCPRVGGTRFLAPLDPALAGRTREAPR